MTTAAFRSPWQRSGYVAVVAGIRRVLRPFGDLEHRYIASLVRANNRRVARHLNDFPAHKVLLIMPRCVKKTGCRVDVQASQTECLSCMECPLGDVAAACERHGLKALVAFRSHIAFDMARREKPDVIIASACHDRMIKALRSVPECPALLAPLAGMERMCINATLDLDWLKAQLELVAPVAPTTEAGRVAAGP
jgi:hypothetical protein